MQNSFYNIKFRLPKFYVPIVHTVRHRL